MELMTRLAATVRDHGGPVQVLMASGGKTGYKRPQNCAGLARFCGRMQPLPAEFVRFKV